MPRSSKAADPADVTHFVLSPEDFDKFENALRHPPQASAKLRELMRRRALWEH